MFILSFILYCGRIGYTESFSFSDFVEIRFLSVSEELPWALSRMVLDGMVFGSG